VRVAERLTGTDNEAPARAMGAELARVLAHLLGRRRR
jgi:hypothetical protein